MLQATTGTMPMGVAIIEAPSGRVLFLNDQVERLLGPPGREIRTLEDFIAYPAFDARGRSLAKDVRPILRALRGETVTGEELQVEREDGARLVLHAEASPVRDASGAIVAAIAVYHDVTEARRAHDAAAFLAEASARLQHLQAEAGLQDIAVLAVPAIADGCFIHVKIDGEVRLVGLAHADPAVAARTPGPVAAGGAVARVLAGGPAELASATEDDVHGHRSAAIAPIIGRDGVLGAITRATATAGRRLEPRDLELVSELARRAAAAVDTMRLLAAEQAARRRAEEATERTRRLQELTARLSAALSVEQVAWVIVGAGRDVLGASAGYVWLCRAGGEALELAAGSDSSNWIVDSFRRIPLDRALPVCDAARCVRPVLLPSRAALDAAYPGMPPGSLYHAWAVVPFALGDRAVGAATFSFSGERTFSDEDREMMSAMMGQASLAFERCRLLEAERRARSDAEGARMRERQLHALAAQLSSALTPAAAADIVCREVQRMLGAHSVIAALCDGDSLAVVARAGAAGAQLADRPGRWSRDAKLPIALAVRAKDIVWYGYPEELAAAYPEHMDGWRARGIQAMGASSFTFEGYTSGSLGLAFREPRVLSDDERELLRAIGQLAAQAIERARLFDALQLREDQLRLALTAGRAGTWRIEIPAMKMAADPSYAALLGESDRTPAPVDFDFVHPDDRAITRACLERTLAEGVRYASVVRLRFGDGSYRWTRSHGRLIRDEQGRPVAVTGVTFDIEEEKQASLRAEAAAAAARAADQRKDEFLAMLGHELRNPLAPIATALDLMMAKGDPRTRERDVIRRQVDHLARLIDDLLDISRITRGKVQLERDVVELGAVIGKAIEMASPLLEKRMHALAVDVPCGLPVDADPTRLAQVFQNLLTNAAKYTEPGGRIDVVARAEGDRLIATVRDTGIGIGPDLLPRLFEPFVQGARALDRSQGGLGIGLAIAQSLCAMHGGTIEAASDGPGRGSTFVVALPRATRAPLAREPSRPLERAARPRRVLVVDDNVDAAQGLEELLARLGYVAAIAHDGPHALEVARAFRPEVAVLDIGLPVMDGYELARRLRATLGDARSRLIALTGYGQDADRIRAREAGFDEHLVKPVGIHVLASLLA